MEMLIGWPAEDDLQGSQVGPPMAVICPLP